MTEPGEIDRRREDEAPEHAELAALNWISDSDLLVFIERLPVAQRQALLLRFMLGREPRESRRVRMGRWRKQATVLRRRRYALMR